MYIVEHCVKCPCSISHGWEVNLVIHGQTATDNAKLVKIGAAVGRYISQMHFVTLLKVF
jgi:hypothetical protein